MKGLHISLKVIAIIGLLFIISWPKQAFGEGRTSSSSYVMVPMVIHLVTPQPDPNQGDPPEPKPDPSKKPEPEQEPPPEQKPEPDPEPEPKPESEPTPTPKPNPTPVPKPTTEPEVSKEPVKVPESESKSEYQEPKPSSKPKSQPKPNTPRTYTPVEPEKTRTPNLPNSPEAMGITEEEQPKAMEDEEVKVEKGEGKEETVIDETSTENQQEKTKIASKEVSRDIKPPFYIEKIVFSSLLALGVIGGGIFWVIRRKKS
ncbi:hypothetical protein [Bacillus sp. REN16]|uniref:hypothetical protein n=1 Tax=Bacillus sp. REN16 TaxID=2887296 RepID=UPI001E48B9B2|nr:hypothetical protein [Bacillus sp. REN16]MCC3356097.1 hypothetical protein [Bacillus sp. REN16]